MRLVIGVSVFCTIALSAFVALPACFNPSVRECAVSCSASNPCPGGASCLSDGFCHASPQDSLCSNTGDAGNVDAPSGDAQLACGNGVVEVSMSEECDDNNRDDNDGCSSSCVEEDGFVCVESPSICRPNPALAGDLVITEMMANPSAVGDEVGEWFEIFNPTSTDFDLEGMLVDSGNQDFTVSGSLPIAAGAHLVLGISDNMGNNGGAPVDFAYGANLSLGNGGDSIALSFDGVLIDATDYGVNPPSGIAISLSGATYDAVSNDVRANFCDAVNVFGDGDLGTPGAMNPACL